jgi:adenylyltransferase/sulfurtransferase
MDFLYVKIERNPDCPLCGDHPTVTGLMDYDLSCDLS